MPCLACRVTHVDGHAHGPVRPGGQATHALGSGVQLSAEQRRRRARYVQQPLRQQQQAVQQRHLRPFQAHQHSETQQQKQPTAGCPDDSASPSFEPPLISPSSRLQEDVVAPSAHAAASGTSSSPHAADSQDGTKGAIIRSTRVSSAFTAAPARAAAERIPLRRLREASVGLWVAREVQVRLSAASVKAHDHDHQGLRHQGLTQMIHKVSCHGVPEEHARSHGHGGNCWYACCLVGHRGHFEGKAVPVVLTYCSCSCAAYWVRLVSSRDPAVLAS